MTEDCDLDDNGNRKVQAFHSSGDRFDEDWRKPKKKWLPYDEYKRAKEEKYEQKEEAYTKEKNTRRKRNLIWRLCLLDL